MSRHAYLITAFDNFDVLETLLRILDDPRNDVYVHIDKRVKDFDASRFEAACLHSPVVFVPRVRVYWGHFTQIQSIFNLLEESTRRRHSYYHLLSGADLPIKTQDEIHSFFEENLGKEFVGFAADFNPDWVSKVHLFNQLRRPKSRIEAWIMFRILRPLDSALLSLQVFLNYDRTKRFELEIKKGSDWFSISHELARYVLANRVLIKRLLRYADIPTEFYVQTLVWNSHFRDRVFNLDDEFISCARFVDWSSSRPRILTEADFDALVESEKLFARKFDAHVDHRVVERVRELVLRSATQGSN